MSKWSVRKAAAVGLILGIINLLVDLRPQSLSARPMFIFIHVLNILIWVTIFGGVAWLRNRFFGRSHLESPE